MEGTRLPAVNPYEDEKGRKFFFDNAKYILITFVVLAHFVSPFKTDNTVVKAMWDIINTMHMPTLIFISGFFAKSYLKKPGIIKVQRPATYLILYIAAQIAVALFELLIDINDVKMSIFYARESLWFLQCLAAWYIILPIIDKFKPMWVIIGAFAFGLLIGYDSEVGHVASLSRMFVHFPFFMLGYYCKQGHIDKLFDKKVKIAGLVITAVICIVALIVSPEISTRAITCNYKYIEIPGVRDWPFVLRWCSRAIFYIVALLLGASFLSWVPRIKTFFTDMGSRTLQVYILHRFIYLLEKKFGLWKPFDNVLGIIFVMGIAVVGTYFMSHKILSYPFDFLQKIKITKLLKKED